MLYGDANIIILNIIKILSNKPYPIYVEFPENLDLNEKKDLFILNKIIKK